MKKLSLLLALILALTPMALFACAEETTEETTEETADLTDTEYSLDDSYSEDVNDLPFGVPSFGFLPDGYALSEMSAYVYKDSAASCYMVAGNDTNGGTIYVELTQGYEQEQTPYAYIDGQLTSLDIAGDGIFMLGSETEYFTSLETMLSNGVSVTVYCYDDGVDSQTLAKLISELIFTK